MVIAAMSVLETKLIVVGIGVAVIALGLALVRYGPRATAPLNAFYANLPGPYGRYQYPAWWPKALGGMVICMGLIAAVAGGVLAKWSRKRGVAGPGLQER